MKKILLFCLLTVGLLVGCGNKENVTNADVEYNFPPEITSFDVDTITIGGELVATVRFETANSESNIIACHNISTNTALADTIANQLYSKDFVLNTTHNYEFYLKATNNIGSVSHVNFVFCNYNPEYWSLVVGQTDQTIRYTVAYGVMQIEYPVVLSEIYTTSGTCLLSQHSPEKTIDVSEIERGIYILQVTLDNGVVVSKRFAKR